jgi:hypothetical protein
MKAPEDRLDIAGQTFDNRLENINREITEIESEMKSRYELHRDMDNELSHVLSDLRVKADLLPCMGQNSYFQKQKDETERIIRDTDRELRLVKQSLWKDTQPLKDKLRELRKDYYNTLNKKQLIEKSLVVL